jgi:hypothetical protein
MLGLFASAFSLQQALIAANLRFCFIGGIVLQRWGEPRFTADIDLTLLCPFGDELRLVEVLQPVLMSRIASPHEMANEARIYLGKLANGTPVDIALVACHLKSVLFIARHSMLFLMMFRC